MLAAASLLLSLAVSPGQATANTSEDELRFGVEVAQKGLWREALFRFEQATALDPSDAKALNNLAVALEQAGDFERARETYEKALQAKPGNLYIQQNYDLFREADDKRNRQKKKKKKKNGGR
jgi:Flp pilus assembly protein TadD